jgi:phenylalanyl-tRNA synthetase beta chain
VSSSLLVLAPLALVVAVRTGGAGSEQGRKRAPPWGDGGISLGCASHRCGKRQGSSMKVLLSWLREFAPIEGAPEFLSDQLSDLGLAVEDMRVIGEGLEGVVVARVLDLRPHPDADKIQLVDVDAGDGEPLQICCGAFNMAVGDLVPLATLGTVMPNGLEISRRKLRGQWSNGMLCSPAELRLATPSDTLARAGIMLLPPDVTVGAPLADALGIEHDVLFDLDVTGNRPDAMSVAGVARDLAARLRVPFSIPQPKVDELGSDATARARLDIRAPEFCGRFVARIIDGVTVGPSPAWLQNRLRAVGQRPINNVVDVSNYVMFELGQPNHTYDLALVSGATLGVRMARDGETLVTLDGAERTLTEADGVIVDGGDVAIGLAGVMGGASTEISAATTSVLLELAWWDPLTIAKTAKRLGLRSEASARFEKGVDPDVGPLAARRFAELLAATGATLAPGVLDVLGDKPQPATVRVRTARVNAILGTALDRDGVSAAIQPIGFTTTPVGDDLDVVVPSFRLDTSSEIEVIEEVARHVGYSVIGKTVPRSPLIGGLSPRQRDRRTVRSALTGQGFDEVMPLPFLAPGDVERAGAAGTPITITNPLVAEESVMRTSLRPGMLKTLAFNASHRNTGLRIFEVGHIYARPATDSPLPDEREVLGVALGGAEAPDAVLVWTVLADALGLRGDRLVTDEVGGMHPTRTARIEVEGAVVGAVGEIDPAVSEAFGVPERVAWLEVDLDTLLALPHGEQVYRPVSRFPSSDIDLAFEVAETCAAAEVEAVLRAAAGPLLVSLRLFDVYRGAPVPAGSRSLAYALRFQAADRTLTDDEIAEVRQRAIDAVVATLPAKLRG